MLQVTFVNQRTMSELLKQASNQCKKKKKET